MTAMKYVSPTWLCSVLKLVDRKHLDELKYSAPRTVSKLADQVG